MDTATVTLFLALLATLAQIVVVAAVLLAVVGRWSPPVRRLGRQLHAQVGPQALAMAAVVAAVCTAGSLYFSEVAHYLPCRLCWFQRVAMYPLVVVLGIGAVRRDASVRLTGSVLAGIGACVSIWHLLIERYPTLESGSCDPTNPCSIKWVEQWGYLTIPGMALSGFALILVLLASARPTLAEETR